MKPNNLKTPISRNLLGSATLACITVFFSLFHPNQCKAALLYGYEICVNELLFALFPFLIAANLLVLCNVSSFIGAPFKPLCRALGFNECCAPGLFAIALLGGFAPAISALSQSVANEQISPKQANRILPLLCFLGPSYIIVAIGLGMLGNLCVGLYLFVSQVLASVISTLLLQWFSYGKKKLISPTKSTTFICCCENSVATASVCSSEVTLPSFQISTVIGDSFFAFLRLCGVILYFQFLSAGICAFLPQTHQWIAEIFLEVTGACTQIAYAGTQAPFRCCIALSLLSASIVLQISALCPKEVSIRTLLYSRILHMPISLLLFRLFLLLPQNQTVFAYSSLSERVLSLQRLPVDQAILLFISFVFLANRTCHPLQNR